MLKGTLFKSAAIGLCYIAAFAGQDKIFAQDSGKDAKPPAISAEDKTTGDKILSRVEKPMTSNSKKPADTFLDVKDNEGGFAHIHATSKDTFDELLQTVQYVMRFGGKKYGGDLPPAHPGAKIDATFRGATADFTFACTQPEKPDETPASCGKPAIIGYGH